MWTETQIREHNRRIAAAEAAARRHARDLDIKPYLGCTLKEWNESQEQRIAAEAQARRALSDAKPQSDQAPPLVRPTPRAAPSLGKVTIRITGRRCRLLDPDNFAGSVKDLLDGLVHAGLIPDDAPDYIRLITEQEKVRSTREEETVIEIEYPHADPNELR